MTFSNSLLEKIAKDASTSFLKNSVDPNETIAKYAKLHKLSAMQIDRAVARSNRKIIVELQKTAASNNPHFIFPTAKTSGVLSLIGVKPSVPAPVVHSERKAIVDRALDKLFPKITKVETNPHMVIQNGPECATKDAIVGAIMIVRDKLNSCRKEYAALEAMLDRAMMNLEKVATKAYLSNPSHVVDSIRDNFNKSASVRSVFDIVSEKYSKYSPDDIDISRVEIMEDNPLSKAAEAIVEIEKRIEQASDAIEVVRAQVQSLQKYNVR